MSRTVDPASDSALHRISLAIVIGDILSKAPFIKWNLGASHVEVSVTNWHYIICHGDAVLHCDIVQSLVPGESR